MRIVKVLLLLVFFFFCMLFFVQNTAILDTPLVLKLDIFGFHAETTGVPFYVTLLLAFVLGGLFSTLYFMTEKVRLSVAVRSLQSKVNAMEKQLAAKNAVSSTPIVTSPASTTLVTPSGAPIEKKAES